MAGTRLQNILFLDIETAGQYPSYKGVPEHIQQLWADKTQYQRKEGITAEAFYERAGIYAEFGKVVCICCGIFQTKGKESVLIIKTFAGEDEKKLLKQFAAFVSQDAISKKSMKLCAHNGKEFDYPYLCRRMLVNGLKIPSLLNIAGMKPWDVPHLDTMEMWKFGDYKHYTSLKLLAAIFELPSSKEDIDGSMVNGVFWRDKNIERIAEYCRQDVILLAKIYCRLSSTDCPEFQLMLK